MQQNQGLMTRFCFGCLISAIALIGCERTYEHDVSYAYLYINQTSHKIIIFPFLGGNGYLNWEIEGNSSLITNFAPPYSYIGIPTRSDSVNIYFGEKELWYRGSKDNEPYSIYNMSNYTDINKKGQHTKATYTFTTAQFDLATEIKK